MNLMHLNTSFLYDFQKNGDFAHNIWSTDSSYYKIKEFHRKSDCCISFVYNKIVLLQKRRYFKTSGIGIHRYLYQITGAVEFLFMLLSISQYDDIKLCLRRLQYILLKSSNCNSSFSCSYLFYTKVS